MPVFFQFFIYLYVVSSSLFFFIISIYFKFLIFICSKLQCFIFSLFILIFDRFFPRFPLNFTMFRTFTKLNLCVCVCVHKMNWGWALMWRLCEYDMCVWCGHDHGHHGIIQIWTTFKRALDVQIQSTDRYFQQNVYVNSKYGRTRNLSKPSNVHIFNSCLYLTHLFSGEISTTSVWCCWIQFLCFDPLHLIFFSKHNRFMLN